MYLVSVYEKCWQFKEYYHQVIYEIVTTIIKVYKNNQDIHINTGLITIDEVTIYDIRGSVLYTKKGINSADFTISNLASSQQMILIQIKSLDGSMVTKKLIF